ncbi:hypothetical protein RRG08_062295 [Elysia crispata]|uniref:Uncharacterized protein n=1 Tax=Elysia crispata TaxID=231223 RepID=A0AAE0YH62_9GAST|nr:hypothetical protein RRG08_062295 [Elysia crispata]
MTSAVLPPPYECFCFCPARDAGCLCDMLVSIKGKCFHNPGTSCEANFFPEMCGFWWLSGLCSSPKPRTRKELGCQIIYLLCPRRCLYLAQWEKNLHPSINTAPKIGTGETVGWKDVIG